MVSSILVLCHSLHQKEIKSTESFPLLKAEDIQLYFNKIAERDPFFKVIFSKLIKNVAAFYLFYFNRRKVECLWQNKRQKRWLEYVLTLLFTCCHYYDLPCYLGLTVLFWNFRCGVREAC